MHQKIVLVFQRHDLAHFWHLRTLSETGFAAILAARGWGETGISRRRREPLPQIGDAAGLRDVVDVQDLDAEVQRVQGGGAGGGQALLRREAALGLAAEGLAGGAQEDRAAEAVIEGEAAQDGEVLRAAL